ncbi:MAG: penicillin binding protein PBP4B [Abditibacteriota bacterium]|nr:penicillin binding protein PBP4B [Abditibacteriota bacterium]
MLRRQLSRIFIIIVILGFMAAAAAAQTLKAEAVDSVPDAGWQVKAVFPDWRGYVDDTLAMNSMASFDGWQGQGYFYVTLAPGVRSLRMFVNGREADLSGLKGGMSARIDYSPVARNGKNTVQVTEIEPGDAEDAVTVRAPYPTVIPGTPEEAGISRDTLALIDDLIASDVQYGFPGAQLAIIRHGKLVYNKAWGKVNAYLPDGTPNKTGAPITTRTLFDLASVTKMFSANYALQRLLTEERFSIDDPVSKYLGDRFFEDVIEYPYADGANPPLETQRRWKAQITIRDLLYHQAGFPPSVEYYKIYPNGDTLLFAGYDGDEKTKAATAQAICKTPLMYEPRTQTKYSDIDYMLLGLIAEQLAGKDLDTYLKETFFEPMGLKRITYNPLKHGFRAGDCAATELNGNTRDGSIDFPGIRTYTLQGQVHDEKAWFSMGGVSGHAGLFACASELATLAGVMLTGGYGEHRFFDRNVIDLFTSPKNEDLGNWGLGWWRNGDAQRPWYFGTEAASNVIGHQGWTGTLVMIDPANGLVIAYLTHKINSPVTDPAKSLSSFNGNWYTASTLGFVAQLLSIGMDRSEDVMPQLVSLTKDMAGESLKLIPKDAPAGHPSRRNADSKAALAKKWSQKMTAAK